MTGIESESHLDLMVYKFIKKGNDFIHTMCEWELLDKRGLTPADVIGKTLDEIYPNEHDKKVRLDCYEKAWAGEPSHFEINMNGLTQIAFLRPIFENGKVIEVIGSSIDITKQKKLEKESSRKENLHQTVLSTMSEGVFIYEKDGKMTILNENVEKIFGLKTEYFNEEQLNELALEYVNEEGKKLLFEELPGVITLKKGVPLYNVVIGKKEKNKIKWLSLNSKPITLSEGHNHAAIISFYDITKQKEQEIELLESYAFQKNLINHFDSGVIALDQNKRIKLMNKSFHKMFQLNGDIESFIGRNISDFYHLLTEENIKKIITKSRKSEVKFEMEIETPTQKVLKCKYFPLKILGSMWKFEDITERKVLERKIIQAKEEADKANRAKSDFLSKMSHELRTPLNGVLGFAQLLELDESLGKQQQDFVQEIVNGGRLLLNLINDILDISRIETGNLKIKKDIVDFNSILDDCIKIVRPSAKKKNIEMNTVNVFWDEDHGYFLTKNSEDHCNKLSVIADPIRLKQVLLNLLENAIKYNVQNGKVTISYLVENDELVVHVVDTGQGFTSEEYNKVFLPFYRINGTKEQGTGIGLSLVKQLVTMMGGSVGVSSMVGVGSDFWFTVPSLKNNPFNEIAENNRFPDVKVHHVYGKSVLYIEDNDANQFLVEKIFKKLSGCHLFSASSGYEGLKIASQEKFDLILLDLNLPDLHGYEVLELLKAIDKAKDVPVIAVSANAMPADIQLAIKKGFTAYLTKPFNINEFLQVVTEKLGQII